MQSIQYNNENHQILNQIYGILTELQEQEKRSHCANNLRTWELKETKKQIMQQKKQ